MAKKKKNIDRNLRSIMGAEDRKAKLHPVEISLQMQLIEEFYEQLKRDEILVDQNDTILIHSLEKRIEIEAKKGRQPAKAIPHLNAFLELYFQIVAYCHGDDDLQHAANHIDTFKKEILEPLNKGELIQKSALDKCEALIKDIRRIFTVTPRKDIILVNEKIVDTIAKHNGLCSHEQMREWLLEELAKVEAERKAS